jgi:hypothetical protein
MKVTPVNDAQYNRRAAQDFGCIQAAEPAANDDHPFPAASFDAHHI